MAAKVARNRTKFTLDEKDIPTKWYNIQADLKTPAPPVLHPGTGQPIGPDDPCARNAESRFSNPSGRRSTHGGRFVRK